MEANVLSEYDELAGIEFSQGVLDDLPLQCGGGRQPRSVDAHRSSRWVHDWSAPTFAGRLDRSVNIPCNPCIVFHIDLQIQRNGRAAHQNSTAIN